jgi:very-short-patch-repair endonuclease
MREHAGVMPFELPPVSEDLAASQARVIACWQSPQSGLDAMALKSRLRYGDWQRLHRGVYATFTGSPTRETQLWGALLRAGPDAVLSHYTAAERHGLLNRPSPAIHITVPSACNPARCGRIPGVIIHRSDSTASTRHPAMTPPCTRIEDTVLDLIKFSSGFDEAYDWICRAVGRRRTTVARIRAALDARQRFPMREKVRLALGDTGAGIMSWLEREYVRHVERPHMLPGALRQVKVSQDTGSAYLDNLYEPYKVCVELDGTAAHPQDEQWRDKRRDRWNLVHEKTVTLRFGFLDLCDPQRLCETAMDVATLLSDRGPAIGSPCARVACPLHTQMLVV